MTEQDRAREKHLQTFADLETLYDFVRDASPGLRRAGYIAYIKGRGNQPKIDDLRELPINFVTANYSTTMVTQIYALARIIIGSE